MTKGSWLATLALGFGLALAALSLLAGRSGVADALDVTVCPAGPPDCQYNSIQAAVDIAGWGDVIKVAAGTYTGVHARQGAQSIVTQVVYISQTLTTGL